MTIRWQQALALAGLMFLHGCASMASADVYTPPSGKVVFPGKKVYLTEKTWGRDWHGSINWERGYIQATANGVSDPAKVGGEAQAELLALKAGRYIAYARLLEMIKIIRVDNRSDIAFLMRHHPNLTVRLQGVLRGANPIYERAYKRSDGWMVGQVTTRLYLKDLHQVGLRHQVLVSRRHPAGVYHPRHETESPVVIVRRPQAKPIIPPDAAPAPLPKPEETPAAKAAPQPAPEAPPIVASKPETTPPPPPKKPVPPLLYTGLIIDAGGLEAKPALFPSVVEDGTGKQLFGLGVIDVNQAAVKGVVGYAPSLEAARKNPRVGPNPLVVSAIQATGLNKAKFSVGVDDAQAILDADAKGAFLSKCKVVIVIN